MNNEKPTVNNKILEWIYVLNTMLIVKEVRKFRCLLGKRKIREKNQITHQVN